MSPPPNQFPSNRILPAFTMVEVVIALAVMATAMLAIFTALRSSYGAAAQSRILTEATLLAETLLTETIIADNLEFKTTRGIRDRLQYTIHIAPTPIDNLAAIHIRVSWPFTDRQRHYELLTLRCIEPTFEGN